MGKFDKKQQSVDSRVVQAINDASLSRRSLIKLLSAGAVMSTGILGFPSLSLAAEKPTQGGKLRAAVSNASATDTLDPAKGSNSADYIRQFMFYSGLTELDKSMAVNRLNCAMACSSMMANR